MGGPGEQGFFFQEVPSPGLLRNANLEAGCFEGVGLSVVAERFTTNPVRGIRERGLTYQGLRATHFMWSLRPDSLEMLQDIWLEHPAAIIEATEFSRPVGAMEKNLVVWEVRDY